MKKNFEKKNPNFFFQKKNSKKPPPPHNNNHISGSPYQIEAELPKQGKGSLCTASGLGLISGSPSIKNHFNVDTSKSGGVGNISVEVRGPSKPEIEVMATGDVSYLVERAGTYGIFWGKNFQKKNFS